MKGLLRQALYQICEPIRVLTLALLGLIYAVMVLSTSVWTFAMTVLFLGVLICYLCSIFALPAGPWAAYMRTLPLSSRTVTGAQYVAGLLIVAAAVLFQLVMGGLSCLIHHYSWSILLQTVLVFAAYGLLALAISLPCFFYKSRFGLVVRIACNFLIIPLGKSLVKLPTSGAPLSPALLIGLPLSALLALAVSFPISCRNYEQLQD